MFSKIGFEPTTSRLQIMCATHCATLYIGNPIFAELVYLSCNVTLLREAGFKVFVMRAYLLHNLNKRSCVGHFYLRIQLPKQCTSLFFQRAQLLLDLQGIHQLRCIFFHIRIHHSQRLFVLCLAVFSKNTETHILSC